MDKYRKVIIILAVVFGCIIIGYIAGQTNSTNQVNLTNAISETNETIEQTYITKYTWNEKDVKTFNNTYYVDRGYKDEPEVMQYVLLRCETQKGDLEAGTYHFETDETVGANFLIYIVDEPIDLNSYEGWYEQIGHDYTRTLHTGFRNQTGAIYLYPSWFYTKRHYDNGEEAISLFFLYF